MHEAAPPVEPSEGQILVYTAEDGRIKIDVRLENETVWLSQQQMAELFQSTQQNISLHLQSVYDDGELSREATHKEYLLVRKEGRREVRRQVDFYNLDAIISIGYRIENEWLQLPFALPGSKCVGSQT